MQAAVLMALEGGQFSCHLVERQVGKLT